MHMAMQPSELFCKAGSSGFHELSPLLQIFSLLTLPFVSLASRPLKAMNEEEIAMHTDKVNSDLFLQLQRCEISPLAIAVRPRPGLRPP